MPTPEFVRRLPRYSASSVIGFFATESAWKPDHNAARLAAEGHWSWRLPSLLQSICSVIILIGIFWMPESPRWLLSKDKHDDTLKVLTHYHAEDDPDDEFVQLEFSEIKAARCFSSGRV
ncbi:hypothetical protein FOXG_18479 [Fusarium oxysporum f. sp. lycopersici 4287]|uniref:Major facilitator superfamily (MFS) profile domain-containing protein n=1 Tax=Fusarium oxysporum f. sp. lycopersici (strain 4287 / CBS 123668 / FGSC 9935 / NRRL 34936) TaxID=426428 RepID=A0A0J9WIP9_FUSO4|nr:hypothetical protein FOXG_18479 [Fusarium oxysporum f. sp. lycopersici 4287]KNA98911.1 hypothetical protein FOXG_18479 [Fusarium oxysporum f. sp. lycopersici 4287]